MSVSASHGVVCAESGQLCPLRACSHAWDPHTSSQDEGE